MVWPQLDSADAVLIWGYGIHQNSISIINDLKSKKVIVIDPIKTTLAQSAYRHIQIKPSSDLYFAILLARFIMIEELNETTDESDEYYELTQTVRIKATLDQIGSSLGDIGAVLELFKNHKVAIVVGNSVAQYEHGDDTNSAIGALATLLGNRCSIHPQHLKQEFLDEIECDIDFESGYSLITHTTYTEDSEPQVVYMHSSCGFKDSEKLRISSLGNTFEAELKLDDRVKEGSILIYSNRRFEPKVKVELC